MIKILGDGEALFKDAKDTGLRQGDTGITILYGLCLVAAAIFRAGELIADRLRVRGHLEE